MNEHGLFIIQYINELNENLCDKNKYDLLWDQKSPEGYIKIMAILQKYIDQGISVNTSYNPEHFEDEKVPMSMLLQHLIMFYKYGGKQLYYNNPHDGQGEIDIDKINRIGGMDISFVTTAKTDKEAKSLLSEMGLPFKKN